VKETKHTVTAWYSLHSYEENLGIKCAVYPGPRVNDLWFNTCSITFEDNKAQILCAGNH
jgi:hypothetical protein